MKKKENGDMKTLTNKQNKIVKSQKMPCFLKASAGTGKTEVLIQKILHLICENQVSLMDFAIITFTNIATFEMQKRLYDSLYERYSYYLNHDCEKANWIRYQLELCAMVQISTIHGFCGVLLREHGGYINISPDFNISSLKQQTEQIVTSEVNKPEYSAIKPFSTYKIVKLIMQFIEHTDNQGIEIKSLDSFYLGSIENEFYYNIKIYLNSYKEIQRLKQEQNILTTNDLIKKTSELLQNESIAMQVANRYQYLFVDEFQDVDINQFSIVETLMKYGTNTFIIGDEKQSIFRFRGADVKNAESMSKTISEYDCNGGSILTLNENFRSDARVIKIINKVFSCQFTYNNQVIHFPNRLLEIPDRQNDIYCEKPLSMHCCKDISFLVHDLLENESLGDRRISYHDIAVLCRTNYEVDQIANVLKNAHIPVEVIGGKAFYKCKEIIDTYKLLNAVLYKSKETLYEMYFTDYYLALHNSQSGLTMRDFIEQMGVTFRHSTVENALHFAYEKSYILEYYRSINQVQSVANLLKLKNIAREMLNERWLQPIQFFDRLAIAIKSEQEEDEAIIPNEERMNGIVAISTIHKAKGMTYPIVILPNAERNLVNRKDSPPFLLDCSDAEHIKFGIKNTYLDRNLKKCDRDFVELVEQETMHDLEEELRIFYVGMTRAQHKIIVSCNRSFNSLRNTMHDEHVSWFGWLYKVFPFK